MNDGLKDRHRQAIIDILSADERVERVVLFGSRAMGTFTTTSDVDIALFGDRLTLADQARLAEAVDRLSIPQQVDILLYKSIENKKLIEHIERYGVEWYRRGGGEGSNWETLPIEKCMAAIIDYRGKTPKKTSSGVPLVTAKIVKNGCILPIQEFIAKDDYDNWMRRGIPQAGDILLTTEAPLGEVAQLDNRKVALAQRLITLRGKSDFLDNTFLKFLMQSDSIQNQLRARSTGTTVIGIKQKELRKVLLTIPPLSEQRAIAHILGSLDDKIELNRRMNQTLEAMARAIFKSWFVDFDPVRAKVEGRDTGLPGEIADLFPDGFEGSEVGVIPRGWVIGKIGDIGKQVKQGVKPEQIGHSEPYIALEHMPKKSISCWYWAKSKDIASSKFRFRKGQILFGKLRPYFHKVCVPAIDGVCSTDIVVITPKNESFYGLLLGHVSSEQFVSYTYAASTGTKMPRTNWKDMSRYEIPIPDSKIGAAYSHQIEPIIEMIHTKIHESKTLSSLRDTLLPKLISGDLRVPDAEKFVEEAGL